MKFIKLVLIPILGFILGSLVNEFGDIEIFTSVFLAGGALIMLWKMLEYDQ